MRSFLLLALLFTTLSVPIKSFADSCTYGSCNAAVCGTFGERFATNQPCDGAPSIPCAAPGCPACTYDACTATLCNTSGTQTASNQPCIGAETLACDAPVCHACSYSTCSQWCGDGIRIATNEPCTGEPTLACNSGTCPPCVYGGACSATVCGEVGTRSSVNQPCTGEDTFACTDQACWAKYEYTSSDFNVVSGTRFSAADALTGTIEVDCALAGGSGDCRSLPYTDYLVDPLKYELGIKHCFTAPSLDNDCTSINKYYFWNQLWSTDTFSFETDANGQLSAYSFSWAGLSDFSGGALEINNVGGSVVIPPGAPGGGGHVTFAQSVWAVLSLPPIGVAVPILAPLGFGALAIGLVVAFRRSRRKD